MDKDTLKEALSQMKAEMRSRVGKKLLSIEVRHHDGEDEDEDEVKGDDVATPKQRVAGMSLIGQ